MEMIHQQIPHEHEVRGLQTTRSRSFKRGILITAAMALHNLPEGLALGIGSLQSDEQLVRGLLMGIAGQNFPEGAMTALALVAAGVSRKAAVLGVLVVGLVEATGAAAGMILAPMSLLAWALMFCGGAMIYVVSQEMIPESHSQGKERMATFSLLVGLIAFGILTYSS
jgi:ZIP family zinc transporter